MDQSNCILCSVYLPYLDTKQYSAELMSVLRVRKASVRRLFGKLLFKTINIYWHSKYQPRILLVNTSGRVDILGPLFIVKNTVAFLFTIPTSCWINLHQTCKFKRNTSNSLDSWRICRYELRATIMHPVIVYLDPPNYNINFKVSR